MAYLLKNQSGVPIDVYSINGPVILPAMGEVTIELSAFEAEVMRQAPLVEMSEHLPEAEKPKAKKGG